MKEIKEISKSKPDKTLHLYLRVSTEIQKTEGGSLETQLKEGIKISKKYKMNYMVWDEGAKSGSKSIEDRIVFNTLMYEVRNGNVKHIFFLDVSRASRKYEYEYLLLKTCDDYDVQLYDRNQKYDLKDDAQMMMIRLQSMFVQFENKQRRLKSVLGKRQHFLRGGWRGGITPFGYDTVERKLVINKEEGKWVKKMFEMYSKGKSPTDISNLFYSKNIKPRKSKSGIFNIGTIHSMLRNKIYIGIDTMVDVDDRDLILEYKGVPKLIDVKTFNLVQKICDKNKQKRKPNTSVFPVLLRKMVFCDDCGEQWGVRIKRNKESYTYYCRNRENSWSSRASRKIPKCGVKRSCSIKQLDELVWNSIIKINEQSHILREKDKTKILQPVNPNKSRSWKQRINSLEKMNTNLEDKKSFIYTQFIADEINKETLEKFQKDIKAQTTQNKNEISELQEKVKIKVQKDGWIDWVKNRQKRIEGISNITAIEKKVEVVKEFLEKVLVSHDKKENTFSVKMKLKLPLFNDKLVYNNPKVKSEGYSIKEGEYEYKDVFQVVSGRPRKKKLGEENPKRKHQHL